ncbi:FAD-dependent oxidoreductase [Aquisalimonas sp.]|uniref:NAD(P)/FAD-dependent oxidoreductase n=1 Tax=unclassified Aquisalimonas TaxID=2644645 RepID=UPI0025C1A7D4|nr:FAD-dependent oxidoreductase [Aquisalimonas sp.]
MTHDSGNNNHDSINPGRRRFLQATGATTILAAAGTVAGGALLRTGASHALASSARIVIVGAGAAGISVASRLARALDGARITLVDPREQHYYQPGLTLVATGAWQPERVIDRNERYIPRGVEWVRSSVAEYDPENDRVVTSDGDTLDYDYLVVATGLQLNFADIEGMDPALIGQDGIACVYDTPDHASRSWSMIREFTDSGGTGLFTRAPGALKCAGAPLKVAMLSEHRLQRQGNRESADLQYFPPGDGMFSQPDIDDFLKSHFPDDRGINLNWHHQLKAIEPGARQAVFNTEDGERTVDYDFIHVVPPMSAPDPVRTSDLAWADGPFEGWLEVDQYTMQHRRYPNVFGVGDVVGTPIGKTAASVKAQVPVAVENLLAVIQDSELRGSYNGYTSCPLITEQGRGILVEFDYDLEMVPSFNFIDPMEEQWVPWLMKDRMLHAAYNAMLRGRI